ncbi:hypothetical protein [Larkinella soli]|uniref:hypothetical protein n=1 Tax=Larkinella soli TaxID=1770527 RepID=UPI000FFC76EB|nr:hypothetical protein [Larkinella soli]
MNIACLGWGSLIWNPGGLLVQNKWFEDGPLLPVELSRQSKNKRITFIIDENAHPVRVLWALMTVSNIDDARASLKERENAYRLDDIHFVEVTDKEDKGIKATIVKWLETKNLDAAVWTGLSFSEFTNREQPSVDYVIKHLDNLEYNTRKLAEEYIRKAPRQIDTQYRRKIEIALGWTPID